MPSDHGHRGQVTTPGRASTAAAVLTIAEDGTTSAPAHPLTSGLHVGRFVVLARIGSGGMGAVYAAHDPELDRKVALKILRGREGDPRRAAIAHRRMIGEAQAMARLSHPNVVTVHDVFEHEGQVVIAMEHVAGTTLHKWLAERTRRWPDVLRVLLDAAQGLAAAHEAGLVHRDVKPDNVMVGLDGRVRVVDFGIALAQRSRPTETSDDAHPSVDDDGHTPAPPNAAIGTPAYMAPEQWLRHEPDAAADQFSWCVMAWEALFGAPPFTGANNVELAAAVTGGALRIPQRRTPVPSWLRPMLTRGLAVEPHLRWPALRDLLIAIERRRAQVRTRRWVGGIAITAALAGGIAGARFIDRERQAAACDAAGDEIFVQWPGRSDAVAAGISPNASTKGYTSTTHRRLAPWLDAWTQAWSETRAQSCKAKLGDAPDKPELHRVAEGCLAGQRAQLEALLDLLAAGDARAIERAISAVASLSPPQSCVDDAALTTATWPADAQWDDVTNARIALSKVALLDAAGKYEQGARDAEAVLADAEALHWSPLVYEALLQVGSMRVRIGDYQGGAKALRSAFFGAGEGGTDRVAARAAIALAALVGQRLADHDAGLEWGEHATMLVRKLDAADTLLAAELANSLALVRQSRGDYEQAQALHEHALAIRERLLGAEHPQLAASLHNLAYVLQQRGDLGEARRLYLRALALSEAAHGPDHPDVAAMLNNFALLERARGAYESAQGMHERALAIWTEALGPEHAFVATAYNNIGLVMQARGDLDDAERMHGRAVAIAERALGTTHLSVGEFVANTAIVQWRRGAYEDARTLAERALGIFEATLPADHPSIVRALNNLGTIHRSRKASKTAATYFARALATVEGVRPDDVTIVDALNGLAEVALDEQRPADAVALGERSVGVATRVGAPAQSFAAAEFVLARALWAAGSSERARALDLARSAARRQRASGTLDAVAEIEAWTAARDTD